LEGASVPSEYATVSSNNAGWALQASTCCGFYPLYEDHFPVESLSQLPEFEFPALLNSFDSAIELLAAQ
jgi:hypothetical protein